MENCKTKLTFEEFVREVTNKIQERIPEAEVTANLINKNNGLKLTGLAIREKGKNVSPTIYLESYYEEYCDGIEICDICDKIQDFYNDKKDIELANIDFKTLITDYEVAKEKICCFLINKVLNEKLLEDVPYKEVEGFNDLVAVFRIVLNMDETGIGTILLHNNHFASLGVSVAEIYSQALENTKKLFPAEFKSMGGMVTELLEGMDIDEELQMDIMPDMSPQMYVLTNINRMNGATALLYDESFFAKVAKNMGGDFYIFPSSVHEVIVAPANQMPEEAAVEMVRDINAHAVAESEILSNNVYVYRHVEDKIDMIA